MPLHGRSGVRWKEPGQRIHIELVPHDRCGREEVALARSQSVEPHGEGPLSEAGTVPTGPVVERDEQLLGEQRGSALSATSRTATVTVRRSRNGWARTELFQLGHQICGTTRCEIRLDAILDRLVRRSSNGERSLCERLLREVSGACAATYVRAASTDSTRR